MSLLTCIFRLKQALIGRLNQQLPERNWVAWVMLPLAVIPKPNQSWSLAPEFTLSGHSCLTRLCFLLGLANLNMQRIQGCGAPSPSAIEKPSPPGPYANEATCQQLILYINGKRLANSLDIIKHRSRMNIEACFSQCTHWTFQI
ncbi:uncharacterized protein VTP21DRAFT_5567 [Calcarisporiella thermophila]|uniref:uncharacterized protein n=1 Tax=Calcarisporiella thermophila TaxID=911321 RepID=UPI0037431B36